MILFMISYLQHWKFGSLIFGEFRSISMDICKVLGIRLSYIYFHWDWFCSKKCLWNIWTNYLLSFSFKIKRGSYCEHEFGPYEIYFINLYLNYISINLQHFILLWCIGNYFAIILIMEVIFLICIIHYFYKSKSLFVFFSINFFR